MKLEFDEVRRLTGPNLLWDYPGAIVDVLLDGVDPQQVAQSWLKWVRRCLNEFDWADEKATYRLHQQGANLAISAPIDALYTACDLAELAWHCCVADLNGNPKSDWKADIEQLRQGLAEERNPELLRLMAAAIHNGTTCLVDDDEVSLGLGCHAKTWPISELPSIDEIDWSLFADIPTAMITGTNGKSTSVRLASEIAAQAGFVAGVTSTDFVRVGQDIIDTGDYSGPGGARILLRDTRTEFALMEVARGGILRRGLPVNTVDAALVTNVASDHLGQYGINTVEQLAEAKFVVSKALGDGGILVVNADDPLVVEQAKKVAVELLWFSLNHQNPLIEDQIHRGGSAAFVQEGMIMLSEQGEAQEVCKVTEAAMTFGGSAKHNIQNALGVVGLCRALGLPLEAIRAGLKSFGSDPKDNPGRGNRYLVNGVQVIVDFAHNEHSMRAVVEMTKCMGGNNIITMFSHAGDRSDQEIKDLTKAVAELDAKYYIAAELENYLRGRQLGEIPDLIQRHLGDLNVSESQIKSAQDPLSGTKIALELAKPGDVVLLFVLDQREQVHQHLSSFA